MDSKVAFTLILMGVIVGSGMMVYNADNLYLSSRDNVVACMPIRMVGGYETSIIATATDSNGEPVAEREVSVILETNNGTYELFEGKTDETGTVQPDFQVPDYKGQATLVVKMGDEKISQSVMVEDSKAGEFTTKILITTDKPIYQPKQTVHIRTLTYEGVELEASERPVEIEIQDSQGNKIFRESYEPNEFGIANLDYVLSDQLPLGPYKINAKVGNKTATKSILVKEYVLPKFKIDFLDMKTWYTVDENIAGKVQAKYFFGRNVEGNVVVRALVWLGEWKQKGSRSGQLSNGEFSFSFSPTLYAVGLDLNDGNGLLELNVTVTDGGGHSEQESHFITIAQEPIQITTLSDTNVEGTESTYYIIARYPNGVPVDNAAVTITIEDETHQKTTDERGIASVQFLYEGQDSMEIDISKGDESTHKEIEITESLGIKVVSDKSIYDVGEVGEFNVYYTGEGVTDLVYYEAISEGFVITTGREKLKDGEASFEIPITPDLSPSATIRVYKIEKDLDVVRDSVLLLVSSPEGLNVSIATDRDIYRPNEEVKLEFYISNVDGPVYSAIGVSGVDLSVFEVSERFQGFEDVFWGLEEEFSTPQYQIIDYVFDPNPVPLSVVDDEVPKHGKENEVGILSSWPKAKQEAVKVKNEWVDNFWGGIALLAILGFFGLFALAIKYKAAAVVAIFMLLIIMVVAAALYVSMSSMMGTYQSSPGVPTGGNQTKDLDVLPAEESGGDLPIPQAFRWDLDDDSNAISYFTAQEDTTEPPTHIRKYFPETWYWNPALITDENGYAFVTLTSPDSITSWGIEAIASTKDAQIGVGETEVTVFQEFFVEPDFPVSVVRGDEFGLRILVYNYLNTSSVITVDLEEDAWFELLSQPTQDVDVGANSVSSVYFTIKANDVGEHNLSIDATNGHVEDKVIKQLKVVPDGKAIMDLRNGQLDDDSSATETVELLPDRVPNSEDAYVKLQGGMEAVVMDGAENFIKFVSGCGEQSTSKLSVNIAAFKNLLKGDVTDEQMFKYENLINQGIQHELIYLVNDPNGYGKAIVWHKGESPDIWLTAWAIFAFQDLVDTGFNIDESLIPGFQEYLVSKQASDGSFSFPDVGHWSINDDLQNEKVAATAYIARALIYSHYPKDSDEITKAMDYLETNTNLDDSAFTLALTLTALEDGNGDGALRNSMAAKMEDLKIEENGTVRWRWTENQGGYFSYYRDHIVETTGYAIMALHKHGGHGDTVNKAVKYLLTNRQGGCFGSTHDTAVAFQALDMFGEFKIEDLTVDVLVNRNSITSIQFTEENKDITYLVDLRPYLTESTEVELQSSGKGSVLYQVYLEQYLPWDIAKIDSPPELELTVTYNTTNVFVNDYINATVNLKYNGAASKLKMVLVDLRSPVGFSFVTDDFESLLDTGTINQYEIRDRQCVVYIDNVRAHYPIVFSYRLKANIPIRATIQGINAYDMYNPNLTTELEPIEMVALL
jgi:hypothetical protein